MSFASRFFSSNAALFVAAWLMIFIGSVVAMGLPVALIRGGGMLLVAVAFDVGLSVIARPRKS
jgi:hypothetical protein